MISIIIPAFNEAKRLPASLEKLANFLKTRKERFEVIVVDDASTDDTKAVAESFKKKIPNLAVLRLDKSPYEGKGLAVNRGALIAKGGIILFTDADFSTPIEEIDKLLRRLDEGYDIAIGSRALDPTLLKRRQNPVREFMGRVFNILVRLFTMQGIADTQCGFKAFKMASTRFFFERQRIFDFGFDVELLYLARKKGLKIAEVPVVWDNDPTSTVHPIKDAISMFADLIKIRLYYSEKSGGFSDKIFYLLYRYRTFLRFSIVGSSNTVVDFGLFYVFTRFLRLDVLVANPISVEAAIIWSFTWNSVWTFSERQTEKPILTRFLIFQFVSLGALILSQDTLFVLNKLLGFNALLAKAATIPIVLIFNYLTNSRWTFRDAARGGALWYIYSTLILVFLALYFLLVVKL